MFDLFREAPANRLSRALGVLDLGAIRRLGDAWYSPKSAGACRWPSPQPADLSSDGRAAYALAVGCAFCESSRDPFLVEAHGDGLILVDQAPLCRGHFLVVPPRHVASSADLPPLALSSFRRRVMLACRVARALSGRTAVAIEHGRTPTCGDPSGACHAHVHVVPVGDLGNLDDLAPTLVTRQESTMPAASEAFIALSEDGRSWSYFTPVRPILHAARTIAALIAEQNSVPWRPVAMSADIAEAATTAKLARTAIGKAWDSSAESTRLKSRQRPSSRPTVCVSGPTGSGKSTVARHLAAELAVPALELGVILRLACLHTQRGVRSRDIASALWAWSRTKRLDFDGFSVRGLAAALPRLDGEGPELAMWTAVEPERLAELARDCRVQDILVEVAAVAARATGAVVVGRVPILSPRDEWRHVQLDASPSARARRKRAQLASVGFQPTRHDWFVPRPTDTVFSPAPALDTTRLSVNGMCAAALRLVCLEHEEVPIALP